MSGYHSTLADCVDVIGRRLAEAELAPLTYAAVWEAFGVAAAMLPTGRTLGEHLAEHPEELTTTGRLMLPGGDG